MLRCAVFALCVVYVTSLRLADVDEGDCRGTRFQPVPANGVDFLRLVPTLRNIVAGSNYGIYQYASGHPRFAQMREQELRENMCLVHNGADSLGRGAAFGFGGGLLANYTFLPRRGQPTVFDFTLRPTGRSLGRSTHTITLTDYKTFVFFANCYSVNNSEHKTWEVLSLTPNLSSATRQRIQNHASSLGFNRKNFEFLNYDTCRADSNPNENRSRSSSRQGNWRNDGANRGWGPIARGITSELSGWNN